MLGSLSEGERRVQEPWLRLSGADAARIRILRRMDSHSNSDVVLRTDRDSAGASREVRDAAAEASQRSSARGSTCSGNPELINGPGRFVVTRDGRRYRLGSPSQPAERCAVRT
jgi:hypothetical protein